MIKNDEVKKDKLTLVEKLKIGCVTAMLSSFFIFDTTAYSSISVGLFCGVLLIVHLLANKGKGLVIKLFSFHYWLLLFGVFCALSFLWALDKTKAINNGITIIENLLIFMLVAYCFQSCRNVRNLFISVFWSGIVISVYTIRYYGTSVFLSMMDSSTRLGNDFANSNTLGMWLAICITICAFFLFTEGWKWSTTLIVFPVIILAMTQSRTALLEMFIGVFLAYIFSKPRGNILYYIKAIIVAGIIITVIVFVLSKIPIFDAVFLRLDSLQEAYIGGNNADSSAEVRLYYIKLGLQTFLYNPILGVGMGSSYIVTGQYSTHSTYFHNNFVELLSCGGVIGFALYYGIFFKCIHYFVKTKKYVRNRYNDLCLIMMIIILISDYGTVSYYKKYMLFLIMICTLQAYFSRKEVTYLSENKTSNYIDNM